MDVTLKTIFLPVPGVVPMEASTESAMDASTESASEKDSLLVSIGVLLVSIPVPPFFGVFPELSCGLFGAFPDVSGDTNREETKAVLPP